MIGEEYPCGNSTFQMTFVSGPNSVGRPFVSATPEPFGPRKRDQSVSAAAIVISAIRTVNQVMSLSKAKRKIRDREHRTGIRPAAKPAVSSCNNFPRQRSGQLRAVHDIDAVDEHVLEAFRGSPSSWILIAASTGFTLQSLAMAMSESIANRLSLIADQ
jgi:hypothetical protein